jgi:hypothetical protein
MKCTIEIKDMILCNCFSFKALTDNFLPKRNGVLATLLASKQGNAFNDLYTGENSCTLT